MASTSVLSGLELTKWKKQFIREFVRDSGFEPYMGASPMDIIHVVNDLKSDGYTIRVPLVKALEGPAITGNARLSGNEDKMDQYYQDVSWEYYRKGIEISKKEKNKSAVDLLAARRPLLREWSAELIKYQIIDTFHMMNGVNYVGADETTVKDVWLANNADRVQFGKLVSNGSSNDHSTALGTLDTTDDKLTPDLISVVKRRARAARPRIRPFKTGTQGREYYVLFCHPLAFKDLKIHTTMTQANREARPRDVESNPLFQDGDLIWDGIICREIPEFYSPLVASDSVNPTMTLVNAGAGGAVDVGVNILCGAQALAYANKQMATPVSKKEDDYGFFDGVGIEMAHGIEKLTWNNGAGARKDVGMFTVYTAITADA